MIPAAPGPNHLGKRRVRTGCLICRKRRRKCDEKKPYCANCELKGFSCEYRTDLTFIQSRNSTSLLANNAPKGKSEIYSSIQFILNDVHSRSAVTEGSEDASSEHASVRELEKEIASDHDATNDLEFSTEHILHTATKSTESNVVSSTCRSLSEPNFVHEQTLFENLLSLSASEIIRDSSATSFKNPNDNTTPNPSSSFGNSPSRSAEVSHDHYETGLLCHYRYNLAPWMDIGDSESFFSIKLMIVAKCNRALLAAILALAACHRSLTDPQSKQKDFENASKYRQEVMNDSISLDGQLSLAKTLLLMLEDLFSVGLHQWRSLISKKGNASLAMAFPSVLEQDLYGASLSLNLRLDLAAAIVEAQPPLFSFFPYMHIEDALKRLSRPYSQPNSPSQLFVKALFFLAECLSLVFGADEASAQYSDVTEVASFTLAQKPSFLSLWTSAWANCQSWYQERPVELQPVVEVRGTEVDLIDAQNTASFPILIFSTPLALASNAVYHISSLLLIIHRPKLLNVVAGPRYSTSHIWHAQSIAGIAANNNSPMQWDPILVAGLIYVAKYLTHESQQSGVLEILRKITSTTGMNISGEIETLRRDWNVAGYNERIITQ